MKIKTLVISTILSLTSGLATAGLINNVNVEIDTELMSAGGNMKTARFSDNDNEFIGCGTRSSLFIDGTSFVFAFCQASLTEDSNVFCSTTNSRLIEEVNGMSAYSYIGFRWNELGECTFIGHSTQSFYIPGKKDK